MTTFVRRVPADYDTAYWQMAPGYMERELGAVDGVEAERHEDPKGFVNTAGDTDGQRKDQPYCFAPYDGLRGLCMGDVTAYEDMGDAAPIVAPIVAPIAPLAPSGAPSAPGGAPGAASESGLARAIPYAIAAVGLYFLFHQTAKQMTPPSPRRRFAR
jgi:hypothetical protein